LDRKEVIDNMTYTFDVKLFDNEIDSSYERLSFTALKQLSKTACGKKGTFGGKQVAEVLDAKVVVDREKTTKAGDPYCWVKARVKIELNDDTSELLYAMESKEKNIVATGFSIAHRVCSICGEEYCGHVPGDVYGGQLCHKELYGVQDIYELKFVDTMDDKKMNCKETKPRICDVLGVDVEERFTYPGMVGEFYITKAGKLKNVRPDGDDLMICVPTLINNPERIVKTPKWTQQEIEDAKTIQRMFGKDNFTHVQKDEDGWTSLMDGDGKDPNVGWCSIGMEKDMFPSLKSGQTVTLDEIANEKA
jgi:hypothetical protein